jgi:Ca-activated chloride channel family protein
MGNAIDVLTFLALAAVLGLGVGAILGVLALALAAPAHAGEAAGGSLLLHRVSAEPAVRAPLLSTDTTFRHDGPILRVRITQSFRNPLGEPQEGLFVIQLPQDAVLERITVRVADSDEDDDTAFQGHEPAVNPALLSAVDSPGMLSRAITGIEPGETILIELEYQQVARYDRARPGLRLLTQR